MPATPLSDYRIRQKRHRSWGRASRQRYPGQRYDAASGLNQNGYRDGYDASIGRYTESDPIGIYGGLSTYSYVYNRPLGLIDPEGLSGYAPAIPWWEIAPSGSAVGGAAISPGAAVVGAGLAGYGLGTLIYPHIAGPLGNAIDKVCREDVSDCDRQWEAAYERCRQLIYEQMLQQAGRRKKRSVTGVTGAYTDLYRCAAGLVSERCGGNAVDYGK